MNMDRMITNQVLYQLSYCGRPVVTGVLGVFCGAAQGQNWLRADQCGCAGATSPGIAQEVGSQRRFLACRQLSESQPLVTFI